ncbi:MAG: hypothetical protein ACREQW_25450 [Candidatus Binatia bacterium]
MKTIPAMISAAYIVGTSSSQGGDLLIDGYNLSVVSLDRSVSLKRVRY